MSSMAFHTTNWSLVARAGRSDDASARTALTTLCQRYWHPLYLFVLKKGIRHDQAEDLIQGFFARIIEKQVLDQANPARGRFRSFLLSSLQNFLLNEHDRDMAQKRGGGNAIVSIEFDGSHSGMNLEPMHGLTPEKIFDRAWAVQVLENVMQTLRAEFQEKGTVSDFGKLQSLLGGKNIDSSYEKTAAELGVSPEALRQTVHRLRRRYGDLLRAEVAHTVENQADVDDEIRSLFTALAD